MRFSTSICGQSALLIEGAYTFITRASWVMGTNGVNHRECAIGTRRRDAGRVTGVARLLRKEFPGYLRACMHRCHLRGALRRPGRATAFTPRYRRRRTRNNTSPGLYSLGIVWVESGRFGHT